MPTKHDKLLVVVVAGFGHDFVVKEHGSSVGGLPIHAAEPVFPSLTCSAQASIRTAALPSSHGMVANGLFDRRLRRPFFWEQSAALVEGPRIWDAFREKGKTVGMLFWQQSMGESVDLILSPAPVHKHHGGMVQDCYSRPADLYDRLTAELGRGFDLKHYWGPLASPQSSKWIADATAIAISRPDLAPDLCLTYLPALDYDLQRFGPANPRARKVLADLMVRLARLIDHARDKGYEVLVMGDYAIAECPLGAVYPNRALADAGLLLTRSVAGHTYPDLCASRAFAMVDHEVAHVHVSNPTDVPQVQQALLALPGMAEVLGRDDQGPMGIAHAHAGELVLIAAEGAWFSYRFWPVGAKPPDYAGHVDIHRKPGFDPCELFFGWPPGRVSQDDRRIKGTHGRVGPGRRVAWTSTFLDDEPGSLIELATAVRSWLNGAQ